MDQDDWRDIEGFPEYWINPLGDLLMHEKGRLVRASVNNFGYLRVNVRDEHGRYHQKGVSTLVAEAFLPCPPYENWNTVLHLNGDYSDCRYTNLMFRPRWHVIRFHKQFGKNDGLGPDGWADIRTIVDIDSGDEFESIRDVCTTDGHYHFEVFQSCYQGLSVPLTFQQYRWAEDLL